MKLKAHTHLREESLPELSEDVERLVRLAYPDAAVNLLAKDQFIDAYCSCDSNLSQCMPAGFIQTRSS